MNFFKFFQLCIAAFVVLSLSGCEAVKHVTAQPLVETNKYRKKAKTPKDKGLVVIKLIDSENKFLRLNMVTVVPKDINSNELAQRHTLRALQPVARGTSVYAGWVTPGVYSLDNYKYIHFKGELLFGGGHEVSVTSGTFEVKAGHVTDLGELVHYLNPNDGELNPVLLRLPSTAHGETLAQYYPTKDNFDRSKFLTWNEDDSKEANESLAVSVAQNPNFFTNIVKLNDKSTNYLSVMGMILTRDAQGEWSTDAVDTNALLKSITKNNAGDTLVSGDEGALFYKASGQEWSNFSYSAEWMVDSVKFIEGDKALIVRHNRNDLVVDQATFHNGEIQLTEVNRFRGLDTGWMHFVENPEHVGVKFVSDNYKYNRRIDEVAVFEFEGKWVISLQVLEDDEFGIYDERTKLVYQFDTKTNIATTIEFDDRLDYVEPVNGSLIGVYRTMNFLRFTPYDFYLYQRSTKEWQQIHNEINWCGEQQLVSPTLEKCADGSSVETSDFYVLGTFVQADNGAMYAVAAIEDFIPDDENDKSRTYVRMIKSTTGGATWTGVAGELPAKYCSHFVPHVTDRLLLSCEGYSSDFYESTDEGRTWEHVRQQEAF